MGPALKLIRMRLLPPRAGGALFCVTAFCESWKKAQSLLITTYSSISLVANIDYMLARLSCLERLQTLKCYRLLQSGRRRRACCQCPLTPAPASAALAAPSPNVPSAPLQGQHAPHGRFHGSCQGSTVPCWRCAGSMHERECRLQERGFLLFVAIDWHVLVCRPECVQ